MYNILTDRFIRYQGFDGRIKSANLPEIYAALPGGGVEAFPALRAHQRHAWHAFLVQLGVIALTRAGITDPPADEAGWRDLIRGAAPGYADDEPWRMVVDDITRPAFMQPPAAAWDGFDTREPLTQPDRLDMLDLAKNHHMKASHRANPEDWLFALVTTQTMNGQVGRGNYPIARMNSGDGSRSAIGVAPGMDQGAHVMRDIRVLLERARGMTEPIGYRWDGTALLWTEEWNAGSPMLELAGLHPLFLEVCRRRRIVIGGDGRLQALKAGSRGRRVNAGAARGAIGDPWTLVDRRDGKPKAMTMTPEAFTYRRIVDYLTNDEVWDPPILARPTPAEAEAEGLQLVMRGVRRMKGGQTEGYHERIIPITSRKLAAALVRDEGGEPAAELEQVREIILERIEAVTMMERILSHSVQRYLAGGKQAEDREGQQATPRPDQIAAARRWVHRFDQGVDERFFDDLQEVLDEPDEGRRSGHLRHWMMNGEGTGLVNRARATLWDAVKSLPCSAVNRGNATQEAYRLFERRIRGARGFPELFEPQPPEGERAGNEPEAEDGNGLIAVQQDDVPAAAIEPDVAVEVEIEPASPGFTQPELPIAEDAESDPEPDQPPTFQQIIERLARLLAGYSESNRGDLAGLRRMEPGRPDHPAFWRILNRYQLSDGHPELERRWGLIIQGMALMTPASPVQRWTAHRRRVPVGRALYLGSRSRRQFAYYKEIRLNRLMAATGSRWQTMLMRIFRMMAAEDAAFDWREMARLILDEGRDPRAFREGQLQISRDYHRAGSRRSRHQHEPQAKDQTRASMAQPRETRAG